MSDEADAKKNDAIKVKSYVKELLTKLSTVTVQIIPQYYVTGVTVLGSELFVVQDTSQVNVYKSTNFTLTNNLMITGAKRLDGIVSCSHNNCLYVSDSIQHIIYRRDLSKNVTTKWSVSGKHILSVTKFYNVLACLRDTGRIQEYTTHGIVIREIILDSGIDKPAYCVQLSTGNFVISHIGRSERRVGLVDTSGHIIREYSGSRGSGVMPSLKSDYLFVDIHDIVLVIDSWSNTVQLLSPTLTYLGDVDIQGDEEYYPKAAHFDELNHRLYIGSGGI